MAKPVPPGMVRVTRVELVWPGKYHEDGTRRLVRPPSLPLICVEGYPGGPGRRTGRSAPPATGGTVWHSGNVFRGRSPTQEDLP